MRVIVCVKQVPDPEHIKSVKTDPEKGTIIREGVPSIVNPFDEYVVEEAIRIKEKKGGEVICLSMGPPQAEEALRKCLSMGADKAFLLTDFAFAGSDTLATAYTLSQAIRKIGDFDIIFCGQQATDGDTAQVGPGIAENLHIAQVTYVNKVEVNNKKVKVTREVEGGYETLESELPCLLTGVKGLNEPRVPKYKDIVKAMDKEIILWQAKDLDVEKERLGLNGSPTNVIRVFTPTPRVDGKVLDGDPKELGVTLAHILRDEGII